MRQEEFARLIGVTQASLSRYEGGAMPIKSALIAMAALCDATTEWIVRGKGPSPLLPAKRKERHGTGELREILGESGVVYLGTDQSKEVQELVDTVIEIMMSRDSGTKEALKQNIRAFKKSLERDEKIRRLEQNIEALKKRLNPAVPPGDVRET